MARTCHHVYSRIFISIICISIILTTSVSVITAENNQGHTAEDNQHNLLPIGKQKSPDSLHIKQLEYSPGGEHFYKKYLLPYDPVVIKNAAKDWPLIEKWKSGDEEFYAQELTVEQSDKLSKERVKNIIEKKLEVKTILSRNSKLLEEISLPLILQCQEFMNKMSSVHLHINNRVSNKISFNDKDEIIVAIDKPLTIFIFGINQSISAESIRHSNMAAVDVERYPDVLNIPYQILQVLSGDIIYIPKYSWYHLDSITVVSFTKIEFDYYPFELDKEKPYVYALDEYKQYLLTKPQWLRCNNTKSTLRHSLNLAIDFQNEVQTSHLRIPKKNKRPDDVVLASGYKMPVLGLGTALLNETTYDSVKHALNFGYRLFDLAHAYPFSETGFSKALSESSVPRKDVFIVTKLAPRYLGYNETLFALEESLERLNTTYLDLYLIHAMDCDDFLLTCEEGEPKGTWKDSWRAMEHAMRIGKIRSLGVSNFYKADIYELLSWSEEPVSVLQNWFDPFNPDKETRKICAEYSIRYMGYSTLGSYWKVLGMDFNPVFSSSTITGIAAHYDYVVASVVLRWAIHENVTVIPRSTNPKHIGQNIRALDLSLLQEEYDLINGFDDWMSEVKDGDFNMENEDIAKWKNEDMIKSNDDVIKSTEGSNKSDMESTKSSSEKTGTNSDASKKEESVSSYADSSHKTEL